MILAENRVPFGQIFVPEEEFENNDSSLWFAAVQLRYYLARITIAPFEIEKATDSNKKGLYLSKTNEYDEDGFKITTTDNEQIFISGGIRGIMYGAYELLEIIGCRFFTPECEKIPTLTRLKIPHINKIEKPVFKWRELNYTNVRQRQKFITMCRLNGYRNVVTDSLGGNLTCSSGCHNFDSLVPFDEYRENHPEYFSYCDGRRLVEKNDNWQLCLTNPDIIDIAVENARKILEENPDKKVFSISQNDNDKNCQCEECLKLDMEEGSAAAAVVKFANAIAERLEPDYPDVIFEVMAYFHSRPAPKLTKPRKNVMVQLVSSKTCRSHPWENCRQANWRTFRPDGTETFFIDDLKDWSEIAENIYVWDYVSFFPFYLNPIPNWRVLQPNLQTLAKYNVKGVFEMMNGSGLGGGEFNDLRTYLLSKLLWNPYCDIEQHCKEFMEYFYGDAAPYLKQYMDMQCDYVERHNCHYYLQNIKRYPFTSDWWLRRYNKLFDKAEKAVAGDGIRLMRVQRDRLSIRWVDVYYNDIMDKRYDAENINKFFTDLRAHNITMLDEWCNLERTYRAWMDGLTRGIYYSTPFERDPESLT